MNKGGFAALYKKVEASPKYQAEKLSVGFLSEVHQFMDEHGITKAELARRTEVSPAYVTKLFNGSANLSVETMAKLALAINCQIHLHLAHSNTRVRWIDIHRTQHKTDWSDNVKSGQFAKLPKSSALENQNGWNDEKFALAA